MGKNKPQRTKGNTKPSSSGRTAELLSSTGVNTFLGFGTLPVDLPGFSAPLAANKDALEERTDISVDSDFRLVLRKVSKRDTVTKVKALQEFGALCREKDDDVVKRVLPYWPRIYSKLAIDQDRKVREAVHLAHKSLVSKVKKNLAPYLKNLMGVWLVGMNDPYAPSACAANQAFQIAFPSTAKQGEALEFCQDDVFNYIEDSMFVQTIDTISDPKVYSRDERESQYSRLVASCLNGLRLFLHMANKPIKSTTADVFRKLLSNAKYWKYANHKDPEIKRGWYSAAQALCEFVLTLIEEHAAKLCPLTLGCLDEENPLVVATIWETSLRIMLTLQDYSQYVNVGSVILPKLFAVLKEGGKGNAASLFPNLLPFLSKFPDSAIEPKIQFYQDFFGSLREALKLEMVRLSPSEVNAIVKAYLECIRFCLNVQSQSTADDVTRSCRTHLITNELVPLVLDVICDQSHVNESYYSSLFDHLGSFLRYLEEQTRSPSTRDEYDNKYSVANEALTLYFDWITPILSQRLQDQNGLDLLCLRLSKYFHHLHYGLKDHNVAGKKGVRFQSANQERDKTKGGVVNQKRRSLKDGPLARHTEAFCQKVAVQLNENSSSLPLLKLYTQIVRSIPSGTLFLSLSLLKDSGKVYGLETGQDKVSGLETGQDKVSGLETGQDKVSVLETGQDKVSGLETGQDKVSVLETGQDKVSVPETGQDKVSVPETGQDKVSVRETEQDKVSVHETGQDKVSVLETGQDKVSGVKTGQDKVSVHETGQDKVSVHETGQDKVSVLETGQDLVSVPETGQDKVSVRETGQDKVSGLETGVQDKVCVPETGQSAVTFVKELLWPMMKLNCGSSAEDAERLKCVVSMMSAALSCTSVEVAVETLNSLCQEGDTLVLCRLIREASELRNSDTRLSSWLRGQYVGQAMVRLAEQLSNELLRDASPQDGGAGGENDVAWTLLKICLATDRQFDPFIAPEYVNKILALFTSSLSAIKPNQIEKGTEEQEGGGEISQGKIVALVCDLAKNLFGHCQGCCYLPSAQDLLLSLFRLSCTISAQHLHADSVSCILEETWVLGTKKLVELRPMGSEDFLQEALLTLKQTLLNKKWKYNEISEIEKLSGKVELLLKAYASGLREGAADDDVEDTWLSDFSRIIPTALEVILPTPEMWSHAEDEYLSRLQLSRTLCVSSILDLPLIEISSTSLESDLPSFWSLVHFTSRILQSMYSLNQQQQPDAPEDSDATVDDVSVDLSLKKNEAVGVLRRHIPSLAKGVAFASKVHVDPRVPKEHDIRRVFREIPRTLTLCVKNLDSTEIIPIMEDTLQRANDGSYCDAEILSVLYGYFLEIDGPDRVRAWIAESIKVEQILGGVIKDKGTNVPHVIYCLMPHFDPPTVVTLVKMVTDMLLSDQQVSGDNDCWILGTIAVCINSDNEQIFNNADIQDCTKNVLNYFVELWKMDPNILNPNWSSKYGGSLQKTTFVSQLCSIFIAVVKKYPLTLEQDSWDAILCTLVGWMQRSHELHAEFLLVETETSVIPAILTFKLLHAVESVLTRHRTGIQGGELNQVLPNLLTEWRELYLENIYAQIIPLFVKLGEAAKSLTKGHLVLEKLLNDVTRSLIDLDPDLILKSSKEILPKYLTQNETDLAKSLEFLLGKLHPMLISGLRPLTLGSHSLLFSLMSKIPETNIGEDNSEDEEKSRLPPKSLVSTLETTSQIVETLMSNFSVGDCCLVQPYTDSFTFTYVYTLSWMQLLKLFSSSSSEVRSEYAIFLQKSKLLEELLPNLFKLMPNNPVLVHDNLKGSQVKTMFTEPFQMEVEVEADFTHLQKAACHVYLTTLRQLPALVRQWWHNQDKCSSDFVNRFTSNYVSGYICQQEIKAVQETETKFSNMVVKARPMAREVVAKYTMEDITFELVIKLPANHPLGPVTIETGQRIGVSSTQWRNWMLQLTTFLTYQNGSILDGLSLWKRNVDKRFEGIEECMICFYVLHGATCQLPKLTCRTCKKRFHSACLFKWFNTSQNSSCPLCRNLF